MPLSETKGWPGQDKAASGMSVFLGDSQALQREEEGLPVGQEGARAPGCGTGCWGSLHGACGWAVLPSCMPASQGHGLQKKTRAFLFLACSFSPRDSPWAREGPSLAPSYRGVS